MDTAQNAADRQQPQSRHPDPDAGTVAEASSAGIDLHYASMRSGPPATPREDALAANGARDLVSGFFEALNV